MRQLLATGHLPSPNAAGEITTGGLGDPLTARIEGAHSDRAPSASTGDYQGRLIPLFGCKKRKSPLDPKIQRALFIPRQRSNPRLRVPASHQAKPSSLIP